MCAVFISRSLPISVRFCYAIYGVLLLPSPFALFALVFIYADLLTWNGISLMLVRTYFK